MAHHGALNSSGRIIGVALCIGQRQPACRLCDAGHAVPVPVPMAVGWSSDAKPTDGPGRLTNTRRPMPPRCRFFSAPRPTRGCGAAQYLGAFDIFFDEIPDSANAKTGNISNGSSLPRPPAAKRRSFRGLPKLRCSPRPAKMAPALTGGSGRGRMHNSNWLQPREGRWMESGLITWLL